MLSVMKNAVLLLKSLAGMAFLFCVMWAALFLPLKTPAFPLLWASYPQAWIYLAAFFIPVIIITVYIFVRDTSLLQSRLAVGPVAESRPWQKVTQSIASLLFIAIYIVSSLDYGHLWSRVPLWVSYAPAGMVFLSMMFIFKVFRENSFLSARIEVQQGQKLVSTGLYGVVRHPMYAGASVMLLFTPLALGSWWGLLPAALGVLTVVLRAIDEERDLKANLEGYAEYCRKVRWRIIPFIF